jgi:nuclear receptor subfamily 1 group F member 4
LNAQFSHEILVLCVAAVKFGRMSKKQREKVEDEVRFHRAQMRAASEGTAPDSSMFEQQQPSSSDQLPSYSSGG